MLDDDNTRWARSIAACYFEGTFDRFSAYYNDSDLLNPVIEQIKSGQDADRNR